MLFVLNRIYHRAKRDTINNIMLECVPLFASTCRLPACQSSARRRLLSKLQSLEEIDNVPVQVTSRQFGNSSANLKLQFVAVSSTGRFIELHLSSTDRGETGDCFVFLQLLMDFVVNHRFLGNSLLSHRVNSINRPCGQKALSPMDDRSSRSHLVCA